MGLFLQSENDNGMSAESDLTADDNELDETAYRRFKVSSWVEVGVWYGGDLSILQADWRALPWDY